MPQCVLCLRLIGTAIDVYDGGRPKEQLSKNELAQVRKKKKKKNIIITQFMFSFQALTETPSLLEVFSHSFFVGGYLVGPQFCMKKYQG
jgi:lysophospholipid acyltransferase 5